jgi:hypothetical protein
MKVLEKQDLENLLYEIKGFETVSYYYKNLDVGETYLYIKRT